MKFLLSLIFVHLVRMQKVEFLTVFCGSFSAIIPDIEEHKFLWKWVFFNRQADIIRKSGQLVYKVHSPFIGLSHLCLHGFGPVHISKFSIISLLMLSFILRSDSQLHCFCLKIEIPGMAMHSGSTSGLGRFYFLTRESHLTSTLSS